MNIYGEFQKAILRVKIGTEEIKIQVQPDFYTPIPGTESFYMFRDMDIISKLKDLVDRHRKNLGLYRKLRYFPLRNRALVVVDKETQDLVTIQQIYAYVTLFLDARVVYVIKKPDNFISDKLESIENIKDSSINGHFDGDTIISKLV